MEVGFKTDKGIIREKNEDACFVLLPDKVYIVADGVGGGNSGEIASRTAVSEISNYVLDHPISLMNTKYAIVNYLQTAIDNANKKIYHMARNYDENSGMATTLVVLYITGKCAYVANIGDSRAYLFRGNKLVQLTEDHTYVNTLVKVGIISKEEAEKDERKNLIVKALGADQTTEPDFFQIEIEKDDVFLLCSDGLYDEVGEQEIIETIKANENMTDAAKELTERANRNGGHDNITCVLVKVTEEDLYEH